jgi:hypothetical protein
MTRLALKSAKTRRAIGKPAIDPGEEDDREGD